MDGTQVKKSRQKRRPSATRRALSRTRSLPKRRAALSGSPFAACVLCVVPAAHAWPTPWVSSPHPIGLAFKGNDMLMTGGDEQNTERTNDVTAWDGSGQSPLFARLRDRPGCIGSERETYMYTVPEYEFAWPVGTT